MLRRGAGSRRSDDPGCRLSAYHRRRLARPPEDVGVPWGYDEFLKAIADPEHERHTELLEWFGGQFDVTEINQRLTVLAPRRVTRRKTAKSAAG